MDSHHRLVGAAGLLGILLLVAIAVFVAAATPGGYDPEAADPLQQFGRSIQQDEQAYRWLSLALALLGGSLLWFVAGLSSHIAPTGDTSPWPRLSLVAGSLWALLLVVQAGLMHGAAEAGNYGQSAPSALAAWVVANSLAPLGPPAVVPASFMLATGIALGRGGASRLLSVFAILIGALYAIAAVPVWPLLGLGAPATLLFLLWLLAVSVLMLRRRPLLAAPAV